MKAAIFIIISSLLFTTNIKAQNPLGIYIDIDGKIKFWEMEPNRNGHLDDTVFVTFEGKTHLVDLRNFKYNSLTLVEAPKEKWTAANSQDPSNHYDTLDDLAAEGVFFDNLYHNPYLFVLAVADSLLSPDTITPKHPYFSDNIRGARLSDSIKKSLKARLIDYVHTYYDNPIPDGARSKLSEELSTPDTVIDNEYVFDYLVDLAILYDYDKKKRLTRVIGYHWGYGVEVDYLKYDKANNIIYFSRQGIGSSRQEYFFKYNKSGQVHTIISHYRSPSANMEQTWYDKPDISKMKFTYDRFGKMNSKSMWWVEKNIWLTEYYKIL